MPFISAGAVSEASCCLEVVWRVLWGPAHLSSILSTASWIPASALIFCSTAKREVLRTPPRMGRKWGEAAERWWGAQQCSHTRCSCAPVGRAPTPLQGCSPHPTVARPQGGGKHQGLENPGSVQEGLSGKEFFNDRWVFTIALLVWIKAN